MRSIGPLLLRLRGIGPEFATVLLGSVCTAVRQSPPAGGVAGLAPTPWSSGGVEHEQGISKAGNRRLRKTLMELAWSWTPSARFGSDPVVPWK